MADKKAPIRWARRVEQQKIRRLYASDARGIVDEELIDDVGYAMYARCHSIRTVTEAHAGRAMCHSCRAVIQHHCVRDEPMVCEICGWTTTWEAYLKSYQRKQLFGGTGYGNFLEFLERWPQARTPRDKLLAIDWMIHACHGSLETGVGRPAATNLIEGTATQLVSFLDELAYGERSTPGMRENREEWIRKAGESTWTGWRAAIK